MQIRSITVNATGMVAEKGLQGNISSGTNHVQAEKNMFGAECRVTISREGKKLSRQQAAQTEKATPNTQSVKEERKLLRQQEQARLSKEIRDGYRENLNEIDRQITEYNNSYARFDRNKVKLDAAMSKAVEEHAELLTAMQNQKQFQIDESQRLVKEAQRMALQSAGYQDEIDENNRELVTLLKTMEEAEKAEEERENGEAVTESNSSTSASGAAGSVSDVIQNSAAHFMTSSVKREWRVEEMLDAFEVSGRWFLDTANSITQNVLRESANIRAALDDEAFSDEDITDMMQRFQEGMAQNYKDVYSYRTFGLQVLRDAKDARIQHIADDPLKGLQETKNSMMLSAVDAALGEVRQSSLDKTSQELADEAEKLIDERNDVDKIRPDEEEENEKLLEETKDEEESEYRIEYTD